MKAFHHTLFIVLSLLFISCQIEDNVEELVSSQVFYATGEISTRTQLNEPSDWTWNHNPGRYVLWNPSDEISIFCQNGSGRFVSTNTEETSGTVTFVGTLNNVQDRKPADLFWAVYPYSEENSFDGQSVGVSLPAEQCARLDNVEKGLLISMARSENHELYFLNLCGIISIPVYEKGIKKIVFKGNNEEPLAGKVKASFDESGHPFVSEWKEPVKEITLLPKDGESFVSDSLYNVVCFPTYFEKGYTIEFYREELVSIKQIHTPVTLSRAGFVNMFKLYTGGTIASEEYEGKTYSLNYAWKEDEGVRYWVTTNEKTYEIPDLFNVLPDENPTRLGPAVAINTDTGVIYFAMANVSGRYYDYDSGVVNDYYIDTSYIYRITASGIEKTEQEIGLYPYFRINEARHSLELHSYKHAYDSDTYYHYYLEKMSNNKWADVFWLFGDPNGESSVDYSSSGCNTKTLSDIIFLYQEEFPRISLDTTAVDLGLSVKWGSCNLGAHAPEQYGDLYAWGEITSKDSFTSENYIFGGSHSDPYSYWDYLGCTKYNDKDEKYFLDSEDDAAHVKLGEDWRTPSPKEWQELMDNCSWQWTSVHDIVGVVGKSKINGNCVFFPMNYTLGQEEGLEFGIYHSSHVGTAENCEFVSYYNDFGQAIDVLFSYYTEEGIKNVSEFTISSRYEGAAIRPVFGHIDVKDVELDKDRIEIITVGESVNLCASVLPGNATNKSVTWTSSDESVAVVSQSGLVTGVSDGRAVITVSTREGGFEASCDVVVGIVPITDMYFSSPEIGLFVGDTRDFYTIILPEDATYQEVSWSSSNPSVVSVSGTGEVRGMSEGSAVITATAIYGGKTTSRNVIVFQGPRLDESLEYVDMGLSVKWASCNLGALKPEEFGDYFAWGETETKDDYSWETYKWCMGSQNTLTKYCRRRDIGYNGFIDNKTELEDADDAARVRLGGKWRMPTQEEIKELVTNCVMIPSERNGVRGCYLSSKNTGNMLFFPASGLVSGYRPSSGISNIGVAYYHSRTTFGDFADYILFIGSDYVSYRSVSSRAEGNTIRPIYEADGGNEGITPGDDINM